MKVVVCGDTAPTELDKEVFSSGIISNIVSSEISEVLKNSDFTILNLETPICSEKNEIIKCGPCLHADPMVMAGIGALSPNLVTLANNHIMDQGVQGLRNTQSLLTKAGIAYVGVGDTPKEACKPHIVTLDGITLGIYACAEREFSIVDEHTPGANPFDPLYSLDHIQELSGNCDYIIVLYHGGKEHYRYPSPELQKICRRFVDKGADLVVCQHSHCIGCKEEYKSGNIIYGQGNFIFGGSNDEFWHSGLIVWIELEKIKKGVNSFIDYLPIIRTDDNRVVFPNDEERAQILRDFYLRSDEIKEDGVVKEKYHGFSREYERYLDACQGKRARFRNKVIAHLPKKMRRTARRFFCSSNSYNRAGYLALQNFIECEAHRELFLEMLKDKVQNSKK